MMDDDHTTSELGDVCCWQERGRIIEPWSQNGVVDGFITLLLNPCPSPQLRAQLYQEPPRPAVILLVMAGHAAIWG